MSSPVPPFELRLTDGKGCERRIPLEGRQFRLGRATPLSGEPKGWILLHDPSVDRLNASLTWDDGLAAFILESRSDRVPVTVDGRPVRAEPLASGSTIQVGGTKLRFLRSETEPDDPLGPPRLPARFRVVRPLTVDVWRVEDLESGETLEARALAVSSAEPHSVERLRREARTLQGMSHPGVVRVLDSGLNQGWQYLVREHVRGRKLRLAARSQPTLRELLLLFLDLLEGLAYVHGQGVVHRDLRPESVRVTAAGVPRIVEFGLLRRLDDQDALTPPGTILGDFTYLAPEQAFDSRVDRRADLYSLGVCLFEALAGRVPFTAGSPHELLHLHLTAPPPPLRSLRPDLPAELEALVARLLMKKPEERFADAEEVSRELWALLSKGDRVPGTAAPTRDWRVGGDLDLKLLEAAVLGCRAGVGCAVAVEAEPGGGRTSLLRHLGRRMADLGFRVLPVDPGPSALQGLEAALNRWGRGPRDLWDSLRHEGPEAAAGLLLGMLEGSERPTLLLINDLERHDATTRAIVEHLAGLSPPPRAGWVIGRLPGPGLPGTPSVRLAPLPPERIAEFLHERGGSMAEATPPHLHGDTAASPRALRTLLARRRGAGPGGLEHDLLGLPALVGQPLPREVLVRASGQPAARVQETLQALLDGGFLEMTTLSGPEAFQVASQDLAPPLPPASRTQRLRRLLEALDPPPTATRALILAELDDLPGAARERLRLLLDADTKGAAHEVLRLWSEHREDLEGHLGDQDLRLARQALCRSCVAAEHDGDLMETAGPLLATRGAHRAEALRLEAQVLKRAGRLQGAVDLLHQALAELGAPEAPPPAGLAGGREGAEVYGSLARALEAQGREEEALDALDAALSLAARGESPEGAGWLLVQRGRLLISMDRREPGGSDFARALEVAEATGSTRLEMEALDALSSPWPDDSEDPEGREDLLERLGRAAAGLGSRSRAARAFAALGREVARRGDPRAATTWLEAASFCLDCGLTLDRVAVLENLAATYLAEGRGEDAERAGEEAVAVACRLHQSGEAARIGRDLARNLRDAGFLAEAERLLDSS